MVDYFIVQAYISSACAPCNCDSLLFPGWLCHLSGSERLWNYDRRFHIFPSGCSLPALLSWQFHKVSYSINEDLWATWMHWCGDHDYNTCDGKLPCRSQDAGWSSVMSLLSILIVCVFMNPSKFAEKPNGPFLPIIVFHIPHLFLRVQW